MCDVLGRNILMSRPHKFLILGAVGLAVLVFAILFFCMQSRKSSINAAGVLRAVQQFRQAHRPVPQTVTFSQLVEEGFLPDNILKQFGASEVTVYLNVSDPHPQMFFMDALMPDGSHLTLSSDGSIQGFSKDKLQQADQPSSGSAVTSGSSNSAQGARQ